MALNRREFLKLAGLSLGAIAAGRYDPGLPPVPASKQKTKAFAIGTARVSTTIINRYKEPKFNSDRLGIIKRDNLLAINEEVISPYGPSYNPRWYRLENGFVHSGHLQRVDGAHTNEPLSWVDPAGQLGEITVAYTQAMRVTRFTGWLPLYRLYYLSVHWMTALVEGPDHTPWYELTDELTHVRYIVPAGAVRPVQPDELTPISPDMPPGKKKIEVSIPDQTLTAYENGQIVLQTKVSTGLHDNPVDNDISTDTPAGLFHIQVKMPSKHMGNGELTNDLEAYELVGVPWVSFFHSTGVALHGTYWHDNFGHPMSHGCVNLRNEDAKWIYRWTTPVANASLWNYKGYGTQVRVIDPSQ